MLVYGPAAWRMSTMPRWLRATLSVAPIGLMSLAASAQGVSNQEGCEIAKDAYVYAFPMLMQYTTQMQLSNVEAPTGRLGQAPFNQFSHSAAFTPPDFRAVVRPNVDTLYSMAHLDLGSGPLVLSVPATDRYFMLTMQSLWTDVFAAPGTRTTGPNTAREFLIVGPGWHGTVPAGLELIRSPTRLAVIGGRTQTNGVGDYDAVHAIQRGYRVVPLSAWHQVDYVPSKSAIDPSIDMSTRPLVQVSRMDPATYFDRFAELLKDNPPGPLDYPMVHRLERLGLRAGRSFYLRAAPSAVQRAFECGMVEGRTQVAALAKKAAGSGGSGWTYTTTGGAFGANYRERAAVAYYLLGMNLPEDAIYPSASVDSEGRPLDGGHDYILHLAKSELPPVHAFWSLTAYDTEGYFIPNPLKRLALGDRDPLIVNPDGSLDLYVQSNSPGAAREANWLPSGSGPFTLLLRLYWPKSEALDGRWMPPPIRRLD